jgi:hypothetical protein
MSTTTIRVTPETQDLLRILADQENLSIQSVVHEAVSEYRRRQILAQGNVAYAALREDPAAWEIELQERREWESALADGLEAE